MPAGDGNGIRTMGTVSPEFAEYCPVLPTALTLSGCFSQGAYLRSPGGATLLLHESRYGLIPFGIGADGLGSVLEWLRDAGGVWAAAEGDGTPRPGAAVSLALRVQALPPAGEAPPDAARLLRMCLGALEDCPHSLGAAALGLSRGEGIGTGLFLPRARSGISALRAALQNGGEKQQLRWALEQLLGLGWGLTPSMDDFLTGAVYTLLYARHDWGLLLPGAIRLAEEIRTLAPKKTGAYSAAYLCAAAAGQRFSLLDQILDGNCGRQNGITTLTQVGSSSGADMLSGIYWSLQVLFRFFRGKDLTDIIFGHSVIVEY